MNILAGAVPLNMTLLQMASFCGVGFLIVMVILAVLAMCTSIIGKFFESVDKKNKYQSTIKVNGEELL